MALTTITEQSTHPAAPGTLAARLEEIVDPGTLRLLHPDDGSGAGGALGELGGRSVACYGTDPSVRGGALGPSGCDHIVETIQFALGRDLPIIGLWKSGGASLQDGVASLDGVGRIFAAIVEASGRVPQISIVDGPAAGGAAYGAALTDLVILTDDARAFVTGPRVVSEVTGETVESRALGGPELHGRQSGVAHLCVDTLADARDAAAAAVDLLVRPGRLDIGSLETEPEDPSRHVPPAARSVYDVRKVVDDLLDEPALVLQERWAPNVLIALGRVAGRAVGVVANNPWRLGGCLDAEAGDKAARFVRMCDAFGLPLVVLVDVPGYLPGLSQERLGVLRRGAKLLHAFAAARVPRITIHVRKAYGGAFVAMNSRGLGASRVVAWPSAELGVMNDLSAVRVLHRRRIAAVDEPDRAAFERELADEHHANARPMERCLEEGFVDSVIAPVTTRRVIARHLDIASNARGSLTNIPL